MFEVQQKNASMGCIVREGVRRNALRVLCLKSPHSEESAQHIEWRNISWGPHELRERVGRAEAQVVLMLTQSTVNATLLSNARSRSRMAIG